MQKIQYCFLLLCISMAGYAQINIDTTQSINQGNEQTVTSTNLAPLPDEGEHVRQAVFNEITPAAFVQLKKKYSRAVVIDSSYISCIDSTLTLKTKSKQKTYPAKKDYSEYTYYHGWIPYLNLHLLHRIGGMPATGELLLVDHISGKQFDIESPFDFPLEPPLLAPGNKQFITYTNNIMEGNQCYITVYDIVQRGSMFTLRCMAALDIDQWIVKEIAWESESSFAIKTARENTVLNDHAERIKYFKVVFAP